MKKIYLSILFLIISINADAHVNHYEKYNHLEYDLFRNDKIIGYHKYNFIRNGNNLSVNSTVEFKIRKLGVDLYNYFAESEEIYKNDEFHSFS
mgnify:FL=1